MNFREKLAGVGIASSFVAGTVGFILSFSPDFQRYIKLDNGKEGRIYNFPKKTELTLGFGNYRIVGLDKDEVADKSVVIVASRFGILYNESPASELEKKEFAEAINKTGWYKE